MHTSHAAKLAARLRASTLPVAAALLGALLGALPCAAPAQQSAAPRQSPPPPAPTTTAPPANDEKAVQLVAQAVAAVGGSAYLGKTAAVGRGIFTPFDKGVSQLPTSFIDYMVFPDRERTEFRGGGNHVIQVNTGATGWFYDAAARTLKDQPPGEIENFKLSLRTSLDNLLRGWWRTAGVTLSYVGRREAGLARRNETVRLTYPDGFVVEYEIGAQDHLPAKALYKRQNADGTEVPEEDRYARYLTVGGITLPYIIDHYRAGDQTSRIAYDAIEFNQTMPATLFTKPASFKAVK